MQIPVSWLKDYVDIKLPVEDLAEKLTIAGLEVEKVEYIGVAGGNDKERLVWDREMLLLGQILKVEQHPDADRLVLATVEYGGDEVEVCVTGAPNLFPYLDKGDLTDLKLLTPFALEGAVVYDGHKEGLNKMTLKGRKLRGIYNRCMVCSEKELGISDEHEGIILFTGDDKPGTPLQDVLGDVVLHIDIIPNIARCASIVGVAREVAALTGQPLRLPSYDVQMDGAPIGAEVVLKTENPELNPRFTAIVIEGVKQKPSPYWMQRRLRLAGQRPINVVVDISNPSPAVGFRNQEREPFLARARADCVLALALVHHLFVSANLTPQAVRDQFCDLTNDCLIVEFVPTHDEMFRQLLRFRSDSFDHITLEAFRTVFEERFEIVHERSLPHSPRTLFLMRKRT